MTGRPVNETSPRRSTTVVRPDEEQPLGEMGPRMRRGIGAWMAAPAFDFYALIVVGGLLVGIGLFMVLSSSSIQDISRGGTGFGGFTSQLVFIGTGAVGLLVAAIIPPGVFRRLAPLLMLLGIALQALVLTPLGWEVGGNRNWLRLGSMMFQPSEPLKLALALWLGALLATKRSLLTRPAHLLFPLAPGVGLAVGLVLLGHDLGTAMVMLMLVAGSLWVAGVPRRWFVAGAAIGVTGVLVLALTSSNRLARIDNWLHGTCERDTCMQARQGLMGLAEGGWWGVGPGESRQKWGRLPAAQDDYIFAILGEELGLVGTIGVVLLFTALAVVLFRMIAKVDDCFQQVTIAGVATWLLGQAFINIMVVTGLLPVLGVPLPFISSGGTALISSMLALGLMMSFARSEPGAQEAISARIGQVRRSITVLPAGRGESAGRSSRRSRRRAARAEKKKSGKKRVPSADRAPSARGAQPRRTRTKGRR